jgi:hypothetical protein
VGAGCALRVARCGLRVARCGLRVAGSSIWDFRFKRPDDPNSGYALRAPQLGILDFGPPWRDGYY